MEDFIMNTTILISIISIILGSSLISGIVTIILQRYYKKKDEQKDLYIKIRTELCLYKDNIHDKIISFYKESNNRLNIINKKERELNHEVIETKEQIDKYENSLYTHTIDMDEELYNSLINKINRLEENLKLIDVEKQSLDTFYIDYWNKEIHDISSKHKNLINNLGLIENISSILVLSVGEIDKLTLELNLLVARYENNSDNIISHLNNIIRKIDYTLIQIDKEK